MVVILLPNVMVFKPVQWKKQLLEIAVISSGTIKSPHASLPII
jgi:hypothetical protein